MSPISAEGNAFESGERKAIPAVLVYLRKGNDILMIHRNSQSHGCPSRDSENFDRIDFHQGKWNGLGGKCEKDESPLQAVQREVFEESGLNLPESTFKMLGVIQFPNFKPHKHEDWIVFVFVGDLSDSGDSRVADLTLNLQDSAEGTLHWIPAHEITQLNLWPGDRYFIPAVLESQPFAGTLWYQQGEVVKHWLQRL